MEKPTDYRSGNSTLDDISAVIGFTPTQRIAVWWGDQVLYVPSFADPAHPLAALIGLTAFEALVRAFAKTALAIPHGPADSDVIKRKIAEMTIMGWSTEAIAVAVNLTPRSVNKIRDVLREKGLLKLVNGRKARWQPTEERRSHERVIPATSESIQRLQSAWGKS